MKKNLLLLMGLAVVLGLAFQSCEDINGQEEDTPNPPENGIGFVDLGLSVEWATCNLGASSPDDYGNYYAWGAQNSGYGTWGGYVHCQGNAKSLTKYNQNLSFAPDTSYLDEYTVLQNEDDAAWCLSEGQWRMPTDSEWKELLEDCTWKWENRWDNNGHSITGYRITSKTNSNSIFLRAAGYCGSDPTDWNHDRDVSISYWSSSLDTTDPRRALCVVSYSGILSRSDFHRYYALSIRPVKSK